jgi:hypothetical protein
LVQIFEPLTSEAIAAVIASFKGPVGRERYAVEERHLQ